jgi:methionyl-tRNA formyltransferase
MRIAIAGSGWFAASAALPLLDSHHQIVAVIQNGRRIRGVGRVVGPLLSFSPASLCGLARMGRRHGIPTVWLDSMNEHELAPLEALKPDVVVVAGFSIILKPGLLGLPRLGCLNIHPSLLPRHRGPNPFAAAVLAGERESGVSFHQMDAGIDTGPIFAQYAFPLGPRETAESVYRKACAAVGEHMVEVLDHLEQGLAPQEQDESLASYDKRPSDEQRMLDWRQPAEYLDRQVRAFSTFNPAWFRLGQRKVYVTAACADHRPVSAPPGTILQTGPCLRVATGEGSLRVVRALRSSLRWPAPWTRLRKGDVLR